MTQRIQGIFVNKRKVRPGKGYVFSIDNKNTASFMKDVDLDSIKLANKLVLPNKKTSGNLEIGQISFDVFKKSICYYDGSKWISLNESQDWQESVLSILTIPPVIPTVGDRYLILGTGLGVWTDQDNNIAEWSGKAWFFTSPSKGFTVYIEDVEMIYLYNGTIWVKFGFTLNHNNTLFKQGGSADLVNDDTDQFYHINKTDYGYIKDNDQLDKLKSEGSPTFKDLTLTGDLTVSGTTTTGNTTLVSEATDSRTLTFPDVSGTFLVADKLTVTQTGSIENKVTINAFSGKITTVSGTVLKRNKKKFTVRNSVVTVSSFILLTVNNYTGKYNGGGLPTANVDNIQNGSFDIVIINADNSDATGIYDIVFVVF